MIAPIRVILSVFTRGQKCAIRMIIRVNGILLKVFWPVCTQISITRGNLNCAIEMMVRRCFPVTHLSNHAAKLPYECFDVYICDFFLLGGGGGQSCVAF